jgi:hypothetical protein
MYNSYYRPTGNMVKLMDGRLFKKNQKNLWEDVNSGVSINDFQLQNLIASAAFTADASGGGNTRRESAPDAVVSLSAPFDDIVIVVDDTHTFNANRTITTTAPVTLRITFASVGTYGNATFNAYKNDVLINSVRVGFASAGVVTTLTGSFADGDQLKFSGLVPAGYSSTLNFDVTLEKTAPGLVSVLDVFNISFTP